MGYQIPLRCKCDSRSMKSALYLFRSLFFGSFIGHFCWGQEPSVLEGVAESSQLFLAATTVSIQPSKVEVIFSRTGGEYLILAEDGEEIEEDEVWAVIGKEKVELERAFLKTDESSLPERLQNLAIAHESAKAAQRATIKEAKNKLSELRFALATEEAQAEPSIMAVGEEAIQELEGELSRAEQQLEILEVGLGYKSEVEKLKLGLQRQQESFDLLLKDSEERAKFRGVLRFLEPLYNVNNEPTPRKIFLSVGQAIATLKDEESFDVVLKPLVLDFNGIARSNLFLRIDKNRGESAIKANFKQFVADPQSPETVKAWAFAVEEEDIEDVKRRELGSEALAAVFLDLKEPALIVPKASLLKEIGSEGLSSPSWDAVVKEVLPEYDFVAEGRGGIAVRLLKKEAE